MTAFDDALRSADAAVDRFLANRKIPGVAYGVVRDGELVHSRGIGTLRVGEDAPPDADSVFRIASMSKSFTAATILSLRDEGRLGLDDPIAAHVPELAGLRRPTTDSPVLTVRHLMTMSAGLATDDPWGDRQQGLDLKAFARLLRGQLSFAWPPATRFEYSNLGYGILGRLITNVAGLEYKDAVRERMLAPLGMDATTYEEAEVPAERLAHGYLWRDDAYVEEPMDPYGALASMGGVFSSVRDLARWVAFHADAFPPRDDPEGDAPLSRASRREMAQVHRSIDAGLEVPGLEADPVTNGSGYGYGLFVLDSSKHGRIVGHSGGYPGFGSNMRWHLASGLGVICLANHRYGPSIVMCRDIMEAILDADAVPARRITPVPATESARADAERLIARWDDKLAARLFAMNVELDEPLERRMAALAAIRKRHGALRPDPELPVDHDSPLAVGWWLVGKRGGRVRVDLLMTPHAPPLVQTFSVTSVPEPSPELVAGAERIVGAVNARQPAIPRGLRLGPDVDRAKLRTTLRIAALRFAPVRLGPCVEGDGTTSARWRLTSEQGTLDLAISRDDRGRLTSIGLTQRVPQPPPYAD